MPQIPQLGQSKVVLPLFHAVKNGSYALFVAESWRRSLGQRVAALCWLTASITMAADPPLQVAVELGGRELQGRLALGAAEDDWQFLPENGAATALEHLAEIRFPDRVSLPAQKAGWRRIDLWGGQTVFASQFACRENLAMIQGGFFSDENREVPLGVLAGVRLDFTETDVGPALPQPRDLSASRQVVTDEAILIGGDSMFGRLETLDDRSATFEFPFGRRQLNRREMTALRFARRSVEVRHQIGWHARIHFAPQLSEQPAGSRRRSIGAPPDDRSGPYVNAVLRALGPQNLTVEHPYLGLLQIPLDRVARIEPFFQGLRLELAPWTSHLGNQFMPHFVIHEPQETLELTFNLPHVPEGQVQLAVEATELEAADSARFARQLAAGNLRTQVGFNGQPLGALNQLINASGPSTQRLRLPLSPGVVRSGSNTIRVTQTGQPDDPQERDDCLLGGWALEVQTGP